MKDAKKINLNYWLITILNIFLAIFLLLDVDTISEYNYVLVGIFLLQFVIGLIDYKQNKNNKILILAIISLWLMVFCYVYYYEILFIVFLPMCISLYFMVLGILNYKNNKIISIITYLLAIILIIKPIFNVSIYLKISGIYLLFLIIWYLVKKKK